MEWIKIKDKLPSIDDDQNCAVLAYHEVGGIGKAWFYKFQNERIKKMEEEFKFNYVCSCRFVANRAIEERRIKKINEFVDKFNDENNSIVEFIETPEHGIIIEEQHATMNVFQKGSELHLVGNITHWMPLPEPPKD